MNLTMIRLEGHLVEHTKVVLQITLTCPDVIYTSTPFEWKPNQNCASSGVKKAGGGAAATSTSTSATSTSSSTDSHLHQPISSENSSTVSSSSTCGYFTTNHLSIELEEELTLIGDVKLEIYTKPVKILKKSKLCHCWFNTFFVDGIQQQQQQSASNQREDRNGCNNSEDHHPENFGSANTCFSGSNNISFSNPSGNNGSFSGTAKTSQLHDTAPPPPTSASQGAPIVSMPACSTNSKRDSMSSSENCCSIKVK